MSSSLAVHWGFPKHVEPTVKSSITTSFYLTIEGFSPQGHGRALVGVAALLEVLVFDVRCQSKHPVVVDVHEDPYYSLAHYTKLTLNTVQTLRRAQALKDNMGADISTLFHVCSKTSGITDWHLSFLNSSAPPATRGLIILNQPFSRNLLDILWKACSWHCCADGGANPLYDLLPDDLRCWWTRHDCRYVPDLVKGDLDSLRADVWDYYMSKGVSVVQDHDQNSTDLMKCVQSVEEKEKLESREGYDAVRNHHSWRTGWEIRPHDAYSLGQHCIHIDHNILGPTCGLLPIGVDSTILTTTGLRWNLKSSFNGLISTSNHLVPEEFFVTINTSRPIWWCVELAKKD
ncbi:thiamine pyrophosphokinase [Pisolithus marmoratus]|nr:thiamine pyrophosphokinase [Pisolithus marmoratus]